MTEVQRSINRANICESNCEK